MSVYKAALRAELERLEEQYADMTEGDALIVHEEQGTVRWDFADGGEAHTLERAVLMGRALVRFTGNQIKRAVGQ